MPNIQKARLCRLLAFLAAVVLAVTACGSARAALSPAFKSSSDDAVSVLSRGGDPTELTATSRNLDKLLREAPEKSALSPSEQALVDAAEHQAHLLKVLAASLGAADEIVDGISRDAVLLVSGRLWVNPNNAQFRKVLDDATERLLRDGMCSSFSAAMSYLTPSLPASLLGAPSTAQAPSHTRQSVWNELYAAVAAKYEMESVNQVVDLYGLSVEIFSLATTYVDRLEKLMEAASWHNGGAQHFYARYCL